jgi:hypothetical protein
VFHSLDPLAQSTQAATTGFLFHSFFSFLFHCRGTIGHQMMGL